MDTNKEIEKLTKEILTMENLIALQSQTIEETKGKLSALACTIDDLKQRLEAERRNRQKVLAAGGSHQQFSASIRELRDELELSEDTEVGLRQKLMELESESNPHLVKQIEMMRKKILRLRLKPLVDEYNNHAGNLAKSILGIYELMEELNEPFPSLSGLTSVNISSKGGALGLIPYIAFASEKMQGHHFDWSEYHEERMRKIELLRKSTRETQINNAPGNG